MDLAAGEEFAWFRLLALSFWPRKKAPAATAAHTQLIRIIFLIDLILINYCHIDDKNQLYGTIVVFVLLMQDLVKDSKECVNSIKIETYSTNPVLHETQFGVKFVSERVLCSSNLTSMFRG